MNAVSIAFKNRKRNVNKLLTHLLSLTLCRKNMELKTNQNYNYHFCKLQSLNYWRINARRSIPTLLFWSELKRNVLEKLFNVSLTKIKISAHLFFDQRKHHSFEMMYSFSYIHYLFYLEPAQFNILLNLLHWQHLSITRKVYGISSAINLAVFSYKFF